MWKEFSITLGRMARGSEENPIGIRALLGGTTAVLFAAPFTGEFAIFVVLYGPALWMFLLVCLVAWRQRPVTGRFGRVGRLSQDEVSKARAVLKQRPRIQRPA